MRLWLLAPIYAWIIPDVLGWNKRVTANLRNIAYAPEGDYEWTRTAETKFYKRSGTQVSPGSIPYFSNPSGDKQRPGVSDTREPEDTKRAWAGPGDIGYYKRADVGSSGLYKRLHDAELEKPGLGSFIYYKRFGPESFGMYKRRSPPSFGFHKQGVAGSFGYYKRADPADFGMYRRDSPANFGIYKRPNPGTFALYKRDTEKNRRARAGDVPVWKRMENTEGHNIKKRSAGDFGLYKKSAGDFGLYKKNAGDFGLYKKNVGEFGLYKKNVGEFGLYKKNAGDFGLYKKNIKDEDKNEGTAVVDENKPVKNKEEEQVAPKEENKNIESHDKVEAKQNTQEKQPSDTRNKFSVTYHVIPFPCRLYAANSPTCYHNGIGPRVSRDKRGVMWCECACPEGWRGPECRVRT